ncbi:MAG: hypothetical protein QW667_06985 [Candidatus Bathyarchaeia archaeon]
MKMPKLWEILDKFKSFCKFRGWKTSEKEDWVEVSDKYHSFLCVRGVHPESFKTIASNSKCVVREGLSYKIVDASYMAWLLSEPVSESLIKTFFENADFTKRIALYDLSPLLEGDRKCFKLNFTDSPVFQEFENFLKSEFKVKLKPISSSSFSTADYTVAKVS